MQTNRSTGIVLLVLLALSCQGSLGVAQQPGAQQTQPSHTPQLQPLSVPHLYWHFLIYLSVLDKKSDELAAQGMDGDSLRNDLQMRLQFSDAEFAPIRDSSKRLASNLAAIDKQLKPLRSASPSASRNSQIQALIAQRESHISDEMARLAQRLPPTKLAALEAFMTQFFAPKTLTFQTTAAPATH